MNPLAWLIERAWAREGADAATHTHFRCLGCMQIELGWRAALRELVYVELAAIAALVGYAAWRMRSAV